MKAINIAFIIAATALGSCSPKESIYYGKFVNSESGYAIIIDGNSYYFGPNTPPSPSIIEKGRVTYLDEGCLLMNDMPILYSLQELDSCGYMKLVENGHGRNKTVDAFCDGHSLCSEYLPSSSYARFFFDDGRLQKIVFGPNGPSPETFILD